MGINRIIGISAVIVAAWVTQVIGFSTFRNESRHGPPNVNIVDYDRDFNGENADRTLVDLSSEKGWDISANFVSSDEADRLQFVYQRKRWLSLIAGLVGGIVTYFAANRLCQDWRIALAIVILGPLLIAYGFNRRKKLG